MIGNNNTSQHPMKQWIKSDSSLLAAGICEFEKVLHNKNVNNRLNCLMGRPDVEYASAEMRNDLMKQFLGNLCGGKDKNKSEKSYIN